MCLHISEDIPAFNLIYETRDNSEAFLQSVDLSKKDENIDFWFIANAYSCRDTEPCACANALIHPLIFMLLQIARRIIE